MHTLWTFFLVFWLCLPVPLLWANDGSTPDHVAQHWAELFLDSAPQVFSIQASTPLYQTHLTPTYYTPPVASSRLRDLVPETDRPRSQGLLSSTTWLKGTFVTEAEVARSLGGADWLHSKIPGDTHSDAAHRMVRLGLTGVAGSIRYGMRYRLAGQAFMSERDHAKREVWGEWKSGWTTLRSTIGQQWNNVAGESTRSRLKKTYGRVGFTWKRPTWPELSLSYAQNSVRSVFDPLGTAPQRSHTHNLEGALAYSGMSWNARLVSSYLLGRDLLRGGAETTVRKQQLTAAFHPLDSLTIAPTLGYRQEIQDRSSVRIDSPSASVALQYRQSQQLLIRAKGNYTTSQSSDGLIDTEQVGGRGILSWDLRQSQKWKTLFSLEVAYDRVTNHVQPSANLGNISGLIRLNLAVL
jgi:hypothetical protein